MRVLLNAYAHMLRSLAYFSLLALCAVVCNVYQVAVVPMSIIRAKPIGIVRILDQGDKDDKVVAVCADDPEFKGGRREFLSVFLRVSTCLLLWLSASCVCAPGCLGVCVSVVGKPVLKLRLFPSLGIKLTVTLMIWQGWVCGCNNHSDEEGCWMFGGWTACLS
jgi:hypothetical protein